MTIQGLIGIAIQVYLIIKQVALAFICAYLAHTVVTNHKDIISGITGLVKYLKKRKENCNDNV